MKHSSGTKVLDNELLNLLVAYSELMKIEPCANYIGAASV